MRVHKTVWTIVLTAVLLAVAVIAINGMVSAGDAGETRMVQEAVKNAALTCFAVEGAYPYDLQYLRDNYGLAYDESRYHVMYEAFASNQMPDILVTKRGDGLVW